MVKVSVIVPVFNARDYVVPCVESLLSQTLDDIELVFVDDHGSDDSMDVIHRMAEDNAGKKSKAVPLHYRIPAVCRIRLTRDGQRLLEARIPVFQLGTETTFPQK